MANPNELIAKIESLNKQVASLNAERQRQLGVLESTKKQFDAYVANYASAYGVTLTVENLSAEYNKVLEETNAAALELEKQINYITSGAYKQSVAQPVQSVETVTKTAPTPNGAGFAGFATASTNVEDLPFDPDPQPSPLAKQTVAQSQVAQPVIQAQQTVQPQVAQPVIQAQPTPNMMAGFGTNSAVTPQPQVAPPVIGAQGMPVVQNKVATVSEEVANAEKPITPVGWGTPAPEGNAVNNMLTGMFGTKFGG